MGTSGGHGCLPGGEAVDVARSVNNVPIRLTPERWRHIVEGHPEVSGYYRDVLETLSWPEFIVRGGGGELLAVKTISTGKFLVVVYKETSANDGFVITVFLTRRIRQIERREQVWKRQM